MIFSKTEQTMEYGLHDDVFYEPTPENEELTELEDNIQVNLAEISAYRSRTNWSLFNE